MLTAQFYAQSGKQTPKPIITNSALVRRGGAGLRSKQRSSAAERGTQLFSYGQPGNQTNQVK